MSRMLPWLKGLRSEEKGLSLLELTVVAAIISILAALTAVAVTGTTSTARSTTRTNDIAEVQKAVDRWNGEKATWPVSSVTVNADETALGFDVNGDGDALDTSVAVREINWGTGATGDMYPGYIGSKPKHNADTIDANGAAAGGSILAWVLNPSNRVVVLVSESAY